MLFFLNLKILSQNGPKGKINAKKATNNLITLYSLIFLHEYVTFYVDLFSLCFDMESPKSKRADTMRESSPPTMCHISGVTCRMSHVTRHVSHVTFFWNKVVRLVHGESVIFGAYPV